jgi:hypothetical protein
VLGASASIMGRSFLGTFLRPFALPRPDALSAVGRVSDCACTTTVIPGDMGNPSPTLLAYRDGAMQTSTPA